jgi:hypothetical protein
MNLWNFKNETRIYWQIKWGERKKEIGPGLAGLAGLGQIRPRSGSAAREAGFERGRGAGGHAGARGPAACACTRWIKSNGACTVVLDATRRAANPSGAQRSGEGRRAHLGALSSVRWGALGAADHGLPRGGGGDENSTILRRTAATAEPAARRGGGYQRSWAKTTGVSVREGQRVSREQGEGKKRRRPRRQPSPHTTGTRRARRRGGAGLLSAQGGEVEVVWGCCGEGNGGKEGAARFL